MMDSVAVLFKIIIIILLVLTCHTEFALPKVGPLEPKQQPNWFLQEQIWLLKLDPLLWFPRSIIVNGSTTVVVWYNEGGTHYVLSFSVFNSTVRVICSCISHLYNNCSVLYIMYFCTYM